MNLKNFTEGVSIIRAFYDDPDGYHIGAEHDQLYLYATDRPMDEASVAKLKELGWFQPDSTDDDAYSPEDGWSAFV